MADVTIAPTAAGITTADAPKAELKVDHQKKRISSPRN
jgi:hypothetical protein